MRFYAERDGEVIELGLGFNENSAYEFILERDNDPENPWLEGFDLILASADETLVFEADCWVPVE